MTFSKQYLELVEMEEKGLKAMNGDRYEEAAEWFQKILAIDPDWEDGFGHYNLGCALENIGKHGEARQAFELALQYQPSEVIFWGGLASHLYLFGNPEEAFSAYLMLYFIEEHNDQTEQMKKTRIGILALGEKLGLSEEAIDERIEKTKSQDKEHVFEHGKIRGVLSF